MLWNTESDRTSTSQDVILKNYVHLGIFITSTFNFNVMIDSKNSIVFYLCGLSFRIDIFGGAKSVASVAVAVENFGHRNTVMIFLHRKHNLKCWGCKEFFQPKLDKTRQVSFGPPCMWPSFHTMQCNMVAVLCTHISINVVVHLFLWHMSKLNP